MNAQVLLGILNIILAAIPNITNSKVINQFVAYLLQLEPTIIQFASDVGPVISNIVAAFAANPMTNAQQLAALKVIDAKVDKAFDDAFADYLKNHPDPLASEAKTTSSGSGVGTVTVSVIQAGSASGGGEGGTLPLSPAG